MFKKTSISQMAQPINRLIIKDLSAELVELSENDLQQLIGGIAIWHRKISAAVIACCMGIKRLKPLRIISATLTSGEV